ncbi:hypothetical protein CCACVL1_17113, partial [Corchorus capsularis]
MAVLPSFGRPHQLVHFNGGRYASTYANATDSLHFIGENETVVELLKEETREDLRQIVNLAPETRLMKSPPPG